MFSPYSTGKDTFSAILLVAAAIAVIDSPQRWQTFKRVGIVFVTTLLVGALVAGAIATHYHSSDVSSTLGKYSAYLAMAASSAVGWYPVRKLRRPSK